MATIDCVLDDNHPSRNFVKGRYQGAGTEQEFADKFSEEYISKFSNIHSGATRRFFIAAREVPVNGNGIADLVVINSEDLNVLNRKTVIRSFEFKLRNWQRGLMQAHRYKCFSNASILVLDAKAIKNALKCLDVFTKLGVGLWGFNTETGVITREFTPRPTRLTAPQKAVILVNKITELNFHTSALFL